ncbi:hypothetical protein F4804DRAFT_308220 [Jackrogersella minutella]|nr:hypothetical protein F4804DRAFT_308220 [Jackrogersella minutella]
MFTLLYLFLSLCLVLAQDNRPEDENNHFIFPPLPGPQYSNDPSVFSTNLNFTVGKGQDQPFKWVTNMTSMQIILCQEGNPDSVQRHQITDCIDGTSSNYLYWDGDIGPIDLNNGSQAYLGVWDCTKSSTPVFFSHYMNLTKASSSPSSSSSTTSVSSSSTSSSMSLATAGVSQTTSSTSQPTESSSPSASTASSDSHSNAAAIGGGIGGGIGAALVLVAAAFFFWKYRNGKNKGQQPPGQQDMSWANNNQDYNVMAMNPGTGAYKLPNQPSELESEPLSMSELSPSSPLPAANAGNGPNMEPRRVYEL